MRQHSLCVALGLLPILLSSGYAAAQDVRKHQIGARAMLFHGKTGTVVESTPGSAEARAVVETIVRKTGTPMNLDVRAALSVANAEALVETVNGQKVRVILYNPTWMDELRRTLGTTWFNASIMAHEVGHHLSGHLDPAYDNHKAELEADKFSGFVLQRLGASREQALLPMAAIGTEPTETHPGRLKRVEEVRRGWDEAASGQGANIIRPTEQRGPRVALLIGNSNYERVPALKNPKNDVLALQQEFKRLGFITTTVYDASSRQIEDEIRRFKEHAQDADWAVFYFGGQGKEIDGVNYIVPIEAAGPDVANMYRLDKAFDAVKRAKTVRLVIADACRDDPFEQSTSRPGLLAKSPHAGALLIAEPPDGIVVAYSTRAGTQALDGAGDNSPYTEALIAAMRRPGMELDKVFRYAREHVHKATGGAQVPTVLGDWPAQDLHLSR